MRMRRLWRFFRGEENMVQSADAAMYNSYMLHQLDPGQYNPMAERQPPSTLTSISARTS